MQNVGILTFHNAVNYGAVLQAWSLREAVRSFGHSCRIIDYRPKASEELYRPTNYGPRTGTYLAIRKYRFRKFLKKHKIIGDTEIARTHQELQLLCNQFDIVICGSDQIWHLTGPRGMDPSYFLGNMELPSTRKVAYAASIGSTHPEALLDHDGSIRDWLSDFDVISARDEPTAKIVNTITHKEIPVVCDPTLLPTSANVMFGEQSTKPTPSQCPRILIYGTSNTTRCAAIESFSKNVGGNVISVGASTKFANRSLPCASVETWLTEYAKADFVITGFFHGVQIALLRKIPFSVIASEEKHSKIADSLARCGLTGRWMPNPSADDLNDCFHRNLEPSTALIESDSRHSPGNAPLDGVLTCKPTRPSHAMFPGIGPNTASITSSMQPQQKNFATRIRFRSD